MFVFQIPEMCKKRNKGLLLLCLYSIKKPGLKKYYDMFHTNIKSIILYADCYV